MHLEDYEDGAIFSSLTYGPYPLVIALLLLALDSMLYLLVAVYLDQVIPGTHIWIREKYIMSRVWLGFKAQT